MLLQYSYIIQIDIKWMHPSQIRVSKCIKLAQHVAEPSHHVCDAHSGDANSSNSNIKPIDSIV
jgi:hypothetical protein